ncbi:hypothetical protein FRX31_031332 [Thalictrum thalictroides]|uniref:Transmembrane protein n=1 Tax=Thalictrum thalictroides TaxID=46969 RepID=A0A7J6V297_THATH|nr:hypothetical protein FRX31_031332 [Thalictrum thalictroides]
MESPKGVGEFPAADVVGNSDLVATKNFTVDPTSSEVAQHKEIEEQAQAKKETKQQEKIDAAQKLKSLIIISGVAVAVIGAIFAIAKKLREK